MKSLVLTGTAIERFWSKVDKSGGPDACWPWTARVFQDSGYGQFTLNGGPVGAHRIACASKHGDISGLMALHSCDNPPCCNPDHIFPGTNLDNMADCASKGRIRNGGKRGEEIGNAVLTSDKVLMIVRRINAGETKLGLSRELGIGRLTIQSIMNGDTWSHLTGLPNSRQLI